MVALQLDCLHGFQTRPHTVGGSRGGGGLADVKLSNQMCHRQCWAVTSYCNLVTVIIILFAVTSSVTNY